jgi:fructose-bisphosphate aldolase class I
VVRGLSWLLFGRPTSLQANNIVPVVEPELLIDGSHGIEAFETASTRVISTCVAQLWRKNVLLEGCLFKPQMIIPGADFDGPKVR